MIRHPETVYDLLLRIVLLSVDFVVAVGTEERVHVIILRLMRHEEQVMPAVLFQHRGQSVAFRCYGTLHQVPFHQGRERIQRGSHAMVGMNTCRVEVTEVERLRLQTVEYGCITLS